MCATIMVSIFGLGCGKDDAENTKRKAFSLEQFLDTVSYYMKGKVVENQDSCAIDLQTFTLEQV